MINGDTLEAATIAMLIGAAILHEISHGLVALLLGDDTAKRAHRLTLNPIDHLDPVGSVLVPIVLVLTHAPFFFAWAKPVPVNVSRLRHPRNDAVITALAGPASNLVLMALTALALHALHPITGTWPWYLLWYFGFLNILLCCFNLLPIPPLDGSAVLERMIPTRHLSRYYALRPFTMILVFAFVFFAAGSTAEYDVYQFLGLHWSSFAGYPGLLP